MSNVFYSSNPPSNSYDFDGESRSFYLTFFASSFIISFCEGVNDENYI